jgi:hypothetical protein
MLPQQSQRKLFNEHDCYVAMLACDNDSISKAGVLQWSHNDHKFKGEQSGEVHV